MTMITVNRFQFQLPPPSLSHNRNRRLYRLSLRAKMAGVIPKIAVVGGGIAGAVCASTLARNGISATLFESARGPGGRMSQRRETAENGEELFFDHGAPYFTVNDPVVLSLVHDWESRGIVAQWKETLGTYDSYLNEFLDHKVEPRTKYVGVPGMNSICRSLCNQPGIEGKFGTGVGKMNWSETEHLWSLSGVNGNFLGSYHGVVATDKNIASLRHSQVTGRPPPLDLNWAPDLASTMQSIPARPCFALMLAFQEPLTSVPFKGLSFINSEVLSAAYCDSGKPGRSLTFECWVLHSTKEYAQGVIDEHGLTKPSNETLTKVAEDLLNEFQKTGLCTSEPYFKKAHRWGSAFPSVSIATEEKCLFDRKRRVAICGDFCVSPSVEGAILSGISAASKFVELLSSL